MDKQVKNTPVISSHMLQRATVEHETAMRHEKNYLTSVRRFIFTLKSCNIHIGMCACVVVSHTLLHILILVESCSSRHIG